MPSISVIVPVYKVEKYIHRCVDSILNQTFTDFELILVDDGSPDNCGAICDEYAEKDSRVVVIHQENGGLSAARNAGIDWAFANSNSEWITFVDSDDWVHSEYLERLYISCIQHNVSVSVCAYSEVTEAFPPVVLAPITVQLFSPETFWVDHITNATIACGKLYKKECFRSIRYPVGRIHEDEFTTYKVLFPQEQIAFIPLALYHYFTNPSGITKSGWTVRRNDAAIARREQITYFDTHSFLRARNQIIRLLLWGSETLICELSSIKENPPVIAKLKSQLRKDIRTYRKMLPLPISDFAGVYEVAYPFFMKIYWLINAIINKIL